MTSSFVTSASDGWVPKIVKDPAAQLDYHLVWGTWLEGDTLSSVTWTVAAGLDKGAQSINASPATFDGITYPASTVATVWLSGGTLGATYEVVCHIVTAAGRTEERSFQVVIANR